MTLIEWLSEKRQDLFKRGCIHRYHIIDTTADEWNHLNFTEIEFIDTGDAKLSKRCLDTLGVRRTIKALGVFWLIRFNA